MAKPLFNWLGLVVMGGVVIGLAKRPAIVSNFFNGASKLVGTALNG